MHGRVISILITGSGTYPSWKLRTVFYLVMPEHMNSMELFFIISLCMTSIWTLSFTHSVGHWWIYGDLLRASEGGRKDFHVWKPPLDHSSTFTDHRIYKCNLRSNIKDFDTLFTGIYMHKYSLSIACEGSFMILKSSPGPHYCLSGINLYMWPTSLLYIQAKQFPENCTVTYLYIQL